MIRVLGKEGGRNMGVGLRMEGVGLTVKFC